MKYRKSQWLDANDMSPMYGVQCKPSAEDGWFDCHEAGEPLIYDAEAERDAKLKTLKDKERAKS